MPHGPRGPGARRRPAWVLLHPTGADMGAGPLWHRRPAGAATARPRSVTPWSPRPRGAGPREERKGITGSLPPDNTQIDGRSEGKTGASGDDDGRRRPKRGGADEVDGRRERGGAEIGGGPTTGGGIKVDGDWFGCRGAVPAHGRSGAADGFREHAKRMEGSSRRKSAAGRQRGFRDGGERHRHDSTRARRERKRGGELGQFIAGGGEVRRGGNGRVSVH